MFVKGYGRLAMALLICGLGVVISLMEGSVIGMLVPLLESLQSPESQGGHWISRTIANGFDALNIPFELSTILLSLGALVVGIAGLRYWRLILVGKIRIGFVIWIRSKFMGNMLHADLSYFHSGRLGVMADNLTAQSQAAGNSVGYVIELTAQSTLFLAYFVTALLISPVLTAGAAVALLLIFLGVQPFVKKARNLGSFQVGHYNAFQVVALETLSGIHVIKSFLLERLRSQNFNRVAEEVGDVEYQLLKNRSQMAAIQEVSLFVLIGVIVYLGVSVIDMQMAAIVALLFTLYRMSPRLAGINTLRNELAESWAALHAVSVAMERPAQVQVISGEQPFNGLQRSIELKDVDFAYNGTAEVLRNARLSIEKGKMTAIVGASGAGKSTLMDLLLRYYDPDKGSILVDGTELKELDLVSWRKHIGVVSQDIFLFNDTVANNIALGRPEVGEDAVVDAAKQAYAHAFIQELPDGYETEIGDRGWNLSGGQRQRISLARAIVSKPEILILDEATSSLDSESEQLIQKYMTEIRGTCTLVVVAHRTATIRDADKILVLQDGKIVEEGDWNDLIREQGVFASYQHLQSGG